MGARYAEWVARLLGCAGAELVVVGRERTPQATVARVVAATGETLVVADVAREGDQRVSSALAELRAGACLGVPIVGADGEAGEAAVLLAWEHHPRAWTPEELADLEELARLLAPAAPATPVGGAEAEAWRGRALLSLSESLSATRTLPDVSHAVELVALIQLGCSAAELWLLEADRLRLLPPRGRPGGAPPVPVPRRDDGGPGDLVERLRAATSSADARLLLPLTVGEQTLGVLDLRWDDAAPTADDRPTLDALAAYTAQALQRAALLQERLEALVTLQQSLLPRLRPIPDVEVAARYLPADSRDRVGGDWYDAVALPGGGCAVTVGDVVGHDVHAAATMGQVRTVLRALTWSGGEGPAATLTHLDLALDELGLDTLATAVVAHLRPTPDDGWRLAWSSAGHPPPLLLDPDGRARLLGTGGEEPGHLMLGVSPGIDRAETTLTVPRGGTLLLYTDGLVERSREHLDDGLMRLRAATEDAAAAATTLEALLDGVVTRMTGAGRADDIAVLAVRWNT